MRGRHNPSLANRALRTTRKHASRNMEESKQRNVREINNFTTDSHYGAPALGPIAWAATAGCEVYAVAPPTLPRDDEHTRLMLLVNIYLGRGGAGREAGVGRVGGRPTGGKKRRQHVRSLSVALSPRSPPLELKLAREVWTCIHLLRHRESSACKTCPPRPASGVPRLLAGRRGRPPLFLPTPFKSD